MRLVAVLLAVLCFACADPEPLSPEQEEWNVETCEGLCAHVRCERDWTNDQIQECRGQCAGAEIVQTCTDDDQAQLAFCAQLGKWNASQGYACPFPVYDTAPFPCPMTNPPLCDYEPADCDPGVIPDCWSP